MVRAYIRTDGMRAVRGAKSIATVLACLCLAPLCAHAEQTLDKIRRTNTLVIAYPDDQFPFSSVDDAGKPTGYSIDICGKIASAVRRELKLPQMQVRYVQTDSQTRFTTVADGAADIECGTTTNNAARRSRFSFTVPHFFTTTRMMARKDSGIHAWSDLRGKRVAVVRGSSIVPYAKARDASSILNIRWNEFDTEAEALASLEQGRVDAYADDDVLLYSYRSAMKEPQAFAIVGEALSVDPYSMMMRKDDTSFKALVDREMVRMISEREIYAIYDRWFVAQAGPARRSMEMPMGYLLRDAFHFPSDKVAQ